MASVTIELSQVGRDMLRAALGRGLSASNGDIRQSLGRNCVSDRPQTKFLCGITLQLGRGVPMFRQQRVIRRQLERQSRMTRRNEIVIDGRSWRTNMALGALLGASVDWSQVVEAEVGFLRHRQRSPSSLGVSSDPSPSHAVAAFAADAELDRESLTLHAAGMSLLRRMTRQTASLSVGGFESELHRHANRRLVEEHVERPPMRDVAS